MYDLFHSLVTEKLKSVYLSILLLGFKIRHVFTMLLRFSQPEQLPMTVFLLNLKECAKTILLVTGNALHFSSSLNSL